ncbi:hypothetical protein CDAR_242831 [Caerostris darwini]|uniref:Uncharacterized protein n=1 Tax=Caerostris darwini TaxID=1538125 RepID=A0AAV4W160_9ARAC|nr:hypothetical protein CDAR_242831 [Caerostris darwini]
MEQLHTDQTWLCCWCVTSASEASHVPPQKSRSRWGLRRIPGQAARPKSGYGGDMPKDLFFLFSFFLSSVSSSQHYLRGTRIGSDK